MKGDFSRLRFNKARHYTSVLTQQGRVELDSDANEQRAIDEHLRKTETIDIVGQSGAPVDHAGFDIQLSADQSSLTVSAGRYYVDGLLCENPKLLDYSAQPYLLPAPSVASSLAALRDGTVSAVQVYLEVWQRLVTPIDDPGIKEVALGEADTTDRLQTVWRVVANPVPVEAPPANPPASPRPGSGSAAFSHLPSTNVIAATLVNRSASITNAAAAARTNLKAFSARLSASASALADIARTAAASGQDAPPALSCCEQMALPEPPVEPGKMGALTGSTDAGASPCLPVPLAGYRGLENQLYRVEIHRGGSAADATFKWSRDNGSVVTSIVSTGASGVNVDSLGPDANLGFSPNQWVELTDDIDEFGVVPNQPGALRQIEGILDSELRIVLDTSIASIPTLDVASGHAKLRRWDQSGPNVTTDGVPLSAGNWIELENGIQIYFSPTGTYAAGDYWLIPARTATGNIEWPPPDSDNSRYQPPHRTVIHRAALACIHFIDRHIEIDSCRKLFYPLVDLMPPAAKPALHVTKIGWPNDGVFTVNQLFNEGLQVTFDTAPGMVLTSANFIVEANLPITALVNTDFQSVWAGTLLFATPVFRISGTIARQAGTTLFRWSQPVIGGASVASGAKTSFAAVWNRELFTLAQRGLFLRIGVTLKGRFIFLTSGTQILYLDGRALGQPGANAATGADGKTARIDLILPSGEGAQSSDFESWFTLAPTLQLASLSVVPPTPAPAASAGLASGLAAAAGELQPDVTTTPAPTGDTAPGNATSTPSGRAANAKSKVTKAAKTTRASTATAAAPSGAASSAASGVADAAANAVNLTLADEAGIFTHITDPALRASLLVVRTTWRVTLQYPPLADTNVNLSVSGATGLEQNISVPASVVVSAGTLTQTFVVNSLDTAELLRTKPRPNIVATMTDVGGDRSVLTEPFATS